MDELNAKNAKKLPSTKLIEEFIVNNDNYVNKKNWGLKLNF